MSSTKRVQGDYNIFATRILLNGDLVVLGSTTSTTTTNSSLSDVILHLNTGETGAGVTFGESGLSIDRGQLPNVTWLFSEAGTYWSGKIDAAYVNVRSAEPIDLDDCITLRYLNNSGSAVAAAGTNRAVQFKNEDGLLGGSSVFSFYPNNAVRMSNILIANTSTISTSSGDLIVDTAGKFYLKDVLKMEMQGSDPSNVASTVQLLAKTPSSGGTGLYAVNSAGNYELVNVRSSLWLGLVFS